MLRAEALTKDYGDGPVVESLDFELGRGRITGLVGANGAGKSTTIKMVTGLLTPTAGTVTFDGDDPRKPEVRQRIGYLPEESPLYDDETARGYLRFFAGLYGIDRTTADQRIDELLGRLMLDPKDRERRIGHMSKGMRRKVAIARAALHGPDLLVLDEPTSGLDPFTRRVLEQFVADLRDQGASVLLSAHDLDQVERLCDEILVLERGRTVARGSLGQLRKEWGKSTYHVQATVAFTGSRPKGPVHEAAYDDPEAVEHALKEIRDADGQVIEVESRAPRLDDILKKASGR